MRDEFIGVLGEEGTVAFVGVLALSDVEGFPFAILDDVGIGLRQEVRLFVCPLQDGQEHLGTDVVQVEVVPTAEDYGSALDAGHEGEDTVLIFGGHGLLL